MADLSRRCQRVPELHEPISAATVALEISSRNARVAALQKRRDCLRTGLDLILDQRGAGMADLPGGASGLLVCDSKGKEADRLVTRIEEPKVIDASPTAITLALLLTDEELDEEGWRWRNCGARMTRWIRCRKPSTGCAPR